MDALTQSDRLEHLDRESEALKTAFLEAARQLDSSDHVPDEVMDRVASQRARVRDVGDDVNAVDFDKEQLDTAWRALWEMRELLHGAGEHVDLDTLDGLLVAVERFRHVIRDALDERVPGLFNDTALIVEQLREWLPTTPKAQLAALLGVNERTLGRWASKVGPPDHRLVLVAKLVSILRHAWTPEGIIRWFYRPRADLDGRSPADLLAEPEHAPELISAARSTRSMYAT